jgi:hypothetical protein
MPRMAGLIEVLRNSDLDEIMDALREALDEEDIAAIGESFFDIDFDPNKSR